MDRSHLSSSASHEPFARARELQDATDPLIRMFDTLAQAGCEPKGPTDKFLSRCPLHNTGSRNLKVSVGSDGRVLMHCYHGCQPDAIIAAVGLQWRDMFPAGHRNGPRAKPRTVKSLSPGAAFLDAMTGAGYPWVARLLGVECPYCMNPNAYLTVHDRGGLDVNCPDGCGSDEVRRAVETRAAIAEAGVDLR